MKLPHAALAALLSLALTAAPAAAATAEAQVVQRYIQSVTSKRTAEKFTGPILKAAKHNRVPPLLVAKMVHRESDFDPLCVTDSCLGLMQVNPRYWARPGENMLRVDDNLEAGCRLLRRLLTRFQPIRQALTAYNYGEFHRQTLIVQTSEYAELVLAGR